MMNRTFVAVGTMALALTLAACGRGTDTTAGGGADPASGTCLEGTVDCVDTPVEAEPVSDVFDGDAAMAEARALLGLADDELDDDVRVGRRGEETMMLTEDYRLGRMTVDLDLDDEDRWVVTAVTVELPDGPETVTRRLG